MAKTKIVVLDGYTENPGDLSWAGLEALGDVTVYDRTSYVEAPIIAERIGDAARILEAQNEVLYAEERAKVKPRDN